MNVCAKCGKKQRLKARCSKCGSDVMLPIDFVRHFFGPGWEVMFAEDASIEPAPPQQVRTSIVLPDGEFSTTWQATGIQR